MPTGRVKVFHSERNFGFVIDDENGRDVFVRGDDVEGGVLNSGDLVEFELSENDDNRKAARAVKVTRPAPPDNPVGRTMAPPPSWDELEERDRQRRQARRRRR